MSLLDQLHTCGEHANALDTLDTGFVGQPGDPFLIQALWVGDNDDTNWLACPHGRSFLGCLAA